MRLTLPISIWVPLLFLITFFIGILKKNKRLWIISLIFFVVITLAECILNVPVYKTNSTTIQKTFD
jgi:hypothetical protein